MSDLLTEIFCSNESRLVTPMTNGMSWPVVEMVYTPLIWFHKIISSIETIAHKRHAVLIP
jgi:hypothetical protein